MKIEITKENLVYGVQRVQRAISKNNPIPVLSGIKFQVVGNNLILTATDMTVGISCQVPVKTTEEGSIVIPAKYIADIAKKLPDGKVKLVSEDKKLRITYGKSEASIVCFEAEDFPQLPKVENEIKMTLPVSDLTKMLDKVLIATSKDENRPIFTGVLLETGGSELTMVATDTYRLARCKYRLDSELPETKVIIPGNSLEMVNRLFGHSEFVTMVAGENYMQFVLQDAVIITRLIEGKYPDYKKVLPQKYSTRLKVKVKELLDATDRAALLGDNQVLKYETKEGLISTLVISAGTEIGAIKEEVQAEKEGDDIAVSFSAGYITSALKQIDADEIYFELNGPVGPGIIRPIVDDKQPQDYIYQDYIYLVLPVRTN